MDWSQPRNPGAVCFYFSNESQKLNFVRQQQKTVIFYIASNHKLSFISARLLTSTRDGKNVLAIVAKKISLKKNSVVLNSPHERLMLPAIHERIAGDSKKKAIAAAIDDWALDVYL